MKMVQQSRPDSCLAAVLAKIVGQSEQYVLDWFKFMDPPFCDEDAFIFLAHHGIYLACAIIFDTPKKLDPNDSFDIEFSFNKRIAYLIVESKGFPGRKHAVLWNGRNVLDPLFSTPQELESYEVDRFYPLMITEQRKRRTFGGT